MLGKVLSVLPGNSQQLTNALLSGCHSIFSICKKTLAVKLLLFVDGHSEDVACYVQFDLQLLTEYLHVYNTVKSIMHSSDKN